jgi:hypothetical protein
MSGQRDAYLVGATQIVIGTLSSSLHPYLLTPPPGCCAVQLKLLGASGSTVQILPNAASGATIAGASQAIGGWPLVSATVEPFPIMGPAAFYIGCSGATATVAALFWFSSGGATLT